MKMTLKEVNIFFKAFNKKRKDDTYNADMRTARICCVLANINRDTKKRKRPYTEKDFMPRSQEREQMTPEQMATILKTITLAYGGEIIA